MADARPQADPQSAPGLPDLLNRMSAFVARGHLDLRDVLMLRILQDENGATPGGLAAALDLPASTVSRRVRKLRDLDLLTEQVDPEDLRRCILKPTVKCGSVLHEIRKEFPDGQADHALSVYRTYAVDRAQIASRIHDSGLTTSMLRVLGALGTGKEPQTVGQLVRRTCAPQSTVSTVVAALKARGLVRQVGEETPTADKRLVRLELTEQAWQLVDALLSGSGDAHGSAAGHPDEGSDLR